MDGAEPQPGGSLGLSRGAQAFRRPTCDSVCSRKGEHWALRPSLTAASTSLSCVPAAAAGEGGEASGTLHPGVAASGACQAKQTWQHGLHRQQPTTPACLLVGSATQQACAGADLQWGPPAAPWLAARPPPAAPPAPRAPAAPQPPPPAAVEGKAMQPTAWMGCHAPARSTCIPTALQAAVQGGSPANS